MPTKEVAIRCNKKFNNIQQLQMAKNDSND